MSRCFGWFFIFVASALWLGCASGGLSPKETYLERLWVRDPTTTDQVSFRRTHQMKPLFFENLVIHGTALQGLVAYDRQTANEVWRRDLKNGVEMSGEIGGNVLFISSNDGRFYALEAKTGKTIWSFDLKSEGLGPPTLANDRIFVMSGSHQLYALDSSNGNLVWSYKRADVNSLSVRGNSKPLVYQNSVYVGFNDGFLVSLNEKSGGLNWETKLNANPRFQDVDSEVVLADGKLLVSAFERALYAIDPQNGSIIWQFDEGGYSGVLVEGERVYFPTSHSRMHCLDLDSGKKIWTYEIARGIATKPTIYRGMLIFGESLGPLTVLDAQTGLRITEYHPGRGVFSSPTVEPQFDRIFFTSNEGNLYALKIVSRARGFDWAWEAVRKR